MRNKFYMNEFQYHDGECYVTFNIVDLNELKGEIQVAIEEQHNVDTRIKSINFFFELIFRPLSKNKYASGLIRPRIFRFVFLFIDRYRQQLRISRFFEKIYRSVFILKRYDLDLYVFCIRCSRNNVRFFIVVRPRLNR